MGKWVGSFSGAMLKRWGITAVILFGIFIHTDARAFTVHVVDDDGKPVTNGFRWLVMADNSYHVVPGQANPTPGVPESFTLGVNIHHSGAGDPVANGDTSPDLGQTVSTVLANTHVDLPRGQRYIISVLPWHSSPAGTPAFKQTGWTMSGRNVDINQTDVTVVVHKFPVPTAQLTIIVFEDNQPTNSALDQTQEHGLGGFDLLITDTIGKVIQDAWGNPLGTTYKYKCYAPDGLRPAAANPDGTCTNFPLPAESQPEYLINPITGAPVIDYKGTGVMTSCIGDTPAHPYPTAWTPYEMANCVEPYTTVTVNGTTLLTPMGVGEAVVRYLPQNHYLIEPIPPTNDWIGPTNTLEGGRANDNWARPGEPRFNITLGQLNWISFFGFVKKCNNGPNGMSTGTVCHGLDPAVTPPVAIGGQTTIRGQIVLAHDQHAPLVPGLSPSTPVPDCFVALNNLSGSDENVFTDACNADSTFEIRGVPPGTYQLATWDKAVDYIIDYRTITVPVNAPPVIDLGMVSVFSWFGILKGKVFSDAERTGTSWFQSGPNAGQPKPGVPNIQVNLRFTDGTPIYRTTTDMQGNYSFTQFFPFWRFLVAEIGPDRFKPTGMTAVADDGGDIWDATATRTFQNLPIGYAAQQYPGLPSGPGGTYASMGINPQVQPDGQLFRTDTQNPRMQAVGPIIQDMQARIDWGVDDFQIGENGSITGMISYDLTRTEEDPAQDVLDGWEPGVPGIQINLYKDLSGTGQLLPGQLPFRTTYSTSWNDSKPTGCVSLPGSLWGSPQVVNGVALPDCAETFKTWVQVRPAPYDGFYSFDDLPIGKYIVQVVPPSEYRVRFWGDRDIDFGDPKTPFLEPPVACVGDPTPVPQFHTLFPDQQVPTDFPGGWSPGLTAPACDRKYADLTQRRSFVTNFGIFTDVPIPARMWGTVWNDLMLEFNPSSPNAAGNLALSWMPVTIKDFKGQELIRTYTDQWGHFEALVPSNYDIAPPIPIGLVVSQYTVVANDPGPILDTRAGSPTQGQMITDPFFNPAYGQEVIRENWPFFAGQTTFIDTIVIPNSAFVGNRVPLNCDYLDHSPEIFRVDGPQGGPIVFESGNGPERITIQSAGQLTVNNPDYNPNKPISGTNPTKIVRDHGFGATPGSVTVTYKGEPVTVTVTGAVPFSTTPTSIPVAALSGAIPNGTLLDFVSTSNGALTVARLTAAAAKGDTNIFVASVPTALVQNDTATYEGNDIVTPLVDLQWSVDGKTLAAIVPSGIKTGQLTVTRGDNGKSTTVGVTLHVHSPNIPVIRVSPPPASCLTEAGGVEGCRPIQDAIDAARNGSLILLAPGRYDENVFFWKPVQLQGYGAESTVIDNVLSLANFPLKDNIWNEVQNLILLGVVNTAPGVGTDFTSEQGAGILVMGCDPLWTDEPCSYGNWFADPNMPKGVRPLIDGLTVTGATEAGGGILVNSYAYNLKISNCEIFANQGSIGGGIRFGTASIADGSNNAEATLYNPTGSSFNPDVVVDHNRISQNGSLFGSSGGGISIYGGTDHYQITDNFICGNYSAQYGGGIGHFGLSVDRVNRNLPAVCGAADVTCTNTVNPAWPIQSYADRQIPNPNPRPNVIARNLIVSNESFDEGGGIHLGGELVPGGATNFIPPQFLTLGGGPVVINDNLIHGNKGGDDGGGIRTLMYNGEDVRLNPGNMALPKFATLTVDAAAVATTINVAALPAALNPGDTATYSLATSAAAPVNVTVTAAVSAGAVSIPVAALSDAIPNGTVLDFRKNQWYELDIFNNMIVDNSSADHGGGLSFDDTVNSFVVSNTIANNDATSTAPGAFGLPLCASDDAEGQFCPNTSPLEIGGTAGFSVSIPQVGGIASFAHSTALNNVLQAGAFCTTTNPTSNMCFNYANPVLQDDIIWHNRSFYWDSRINNKLGGLVQIPVRNGYWDMTVYGLAGLPASQRELKPTYSILTDGVGGTPGVGNLLGTAGADPRFVTQCEQPFLGSQCQGFNQYQASMRGAALGNFVATSFTPNGLRGDYHTGSGSSALDTGSLFTGSTSPALLTADLDGRPRPLGVAADIGANEQLAVTTNASFPVMQVLQPVPPAALDFGKVSLFQPVQKTVQIINYGQQNLIVAGASTNSPLFNVINWTGMTTVAPGGAMTVTVAFVPTSSVLQTAVLTIFSNATQSQTRTVNLTGTGF